MEYILQKRAKLVGNKRSGLLCLLNMHDDWIHDQYGDGFIHHGVIYSSKTAFHPHSTAVTGYFKDEETGKWIKVMNGIAHFDLAEPDLAWKETLECFYKLSLKTGCHTKWKKNQNNELYRVLK